MGEKEIESHLSRKVYIDMKKSVVWKIILAILAIPVLAVCGYGIYVAIVFLTYQRIPDNQAMDINRKSTEAMATTETTYTIADYNMGFGAYTADFTFFMDGGSQSRAVSEESVKQCINGGIDTILAYNPDFVVLQEVDTDSTRSFHLNQYEMIGDKMSTFDSAFAVNYHSAYLFYPILEPHGKSNSGIDTLSRFQIQSAVRKQLEVSDGFSKVVDLDRCYSVSRVKVDNGKELVILNAHLSAYGSSDNIKENQLNMLLGEMKREYDAGNYVICGGDFNADFTGDSVKLLNGPDQEVFGWTMPFSDELLPEGIHKCTDYSCGTRMETVRNTDVPYQKGNFVAIVDGFLVSDNIEVEYLENIQTDFVYSDHNPVCMRFRLK